MSNERELDDILESIKNRREQIDKDIEPVLPPKTYDKKDDLLWIDSDDIKDKMNSQYEPLEPPKIYGQEDSEPEEKPEGKVKKEKKSKKQKRKKEKKPFEWTFSKIMAIVISIIVIVAVIVGSVLYCYKNNLYIFEQKDMGYNYQTDIRADYIESYNADNSFVGQITIGDNIQKGTLNNVKNAQNAYFYSGSDITNYQQLRAIDMSHYGNTLENLYATSDAYIKSNQTVIIDTLFEQKAYKVIGAYYTNKNADDNLGYVFPYTINGTLTKQSFAEYREGVKTRFLYNTGYDIRYDDEILSLCSDSNTIAPNYKFVVLCVAMNDIQQTTIVAPPDMAVYYPQSYYKDKDTINPYKFAMGLNWKPILKLNDDETQTKVLKQQDYVEQ